MKKMNECLEASKSMRNEISKMFKEIEYTSDEDFCNIDVNSLTTDETLLFLELRKAYKELDEFNSIIKYLETPVKTSGTLKINERGRYETEDGYEYTSGNRIEALVYDNDYDTKMWIKSSVENNEDGYYIVGYKDISMDGLQVRRRV